MNHMVLGQQHAVAFTQCMTVLFSQKLSIIYLVTHQVETCAMDLPDALQLRSGNVIRRVLAQPDRHRMVHSCTKHSLVFRLFQSLLQCANASHPPSPSGYASCTAASLSANTETPRIPLEVPPRPAIFPPKYLPAHIPPQFPLAFVPCTSLVPSTRLT